MGVVGGTIKKEGVRKKKVNVGSPAPELLQQAANGSQLRFNVLLGRLEPDDGGVHLADATLRPVQVDLQRLDLLLSVRQRKLEIVSLVFELPLTSSHLVHGLGSKNTS